MYDKILFEEILFQRRTLSRVVVLFVRSVMLKYLQLPNIYCSLPVGLCQQDFISLMVQRFASDPKSQIFSRVSLRLKRRVSYFKQRVCRWKCDCYASANALLFWPKLSCFDIGNYILHLYCIPRSTLQSVEIKATTWYFELLKSIIFDVKT